MLTPERRVPIVDRGERNDQWLAWLWSIETLVLKITERRKGQPDAVTIRSSATPGSRVLTPERRVPIADRSQIECDQWLAWVAAMTARRKLRRVKSCARATVHS